MPVRLLALALLAVPLAGCEDPLFPATGGSPEVEAGTGLASDEAEELGQELTDREVEEELIGEEEIESDL